MEIVVSALAVIVALSCLLALIYTGYFRKNRNTAKAQRTPTRADQPEQPGRSRSAPVARIPDEACAIESNHRSSLFPIRTSPSI